MYKVRIEMGSGKKAVYHTAESGLTPVTIPAHWTVPEFQVFTTLVNTLLPALRVANIQEVHITRED